MSFNWIPQLFMDLIGRLLPGALVLLCAIVVIEGPTASLTKAVTGQAPGLHWTVIIVWGMWAYLVGFTLGQLWYQTLGRFCQKRLAVVQDECKRRRLAEHNSLQLAFGNCKLDLTPEALPHVFVMHDHLRLAAPSEASRLLKLRAECRLCHVIILGFGFLALLNLALLVVHYDQTAWITECLLILAIVSCWLRHFRLETYFTNGTCIAWLTLASTGRLKPIETTSTNTEE